MQTTKATTTLYLCCITDWKFLQVCNVLAAVTELSGQNIEQLVLDYYGSSLHCALHSRKSELEYIRRLTDHIFPLVLPPRSVQCRSVSIPFVLSINQYQSVNINQSILINQYQSISIFVYYIHSQTATKTNKQADMLNSPRMEKSYKLQCRTALEPTLALGLQNRHY